MLRKHQDAQAVLDAAADSRRALLADLGHELGTPLHAITGSLELIDIRLCAPEDQTRLAQARESAKRLDGVLQALLAVAAVEPMTAIVETRSPSSILDELLERWQRRAARRGQLLVGGVLGNNEPARFEWSTVVQPVDAILDAATQHASAGALHVEIVANHGVFAIVIEDSGPELPPISTATISSDDSPVRWAAMGRRGIGLAVAQQMANTSAATLAVSAGSLGGIRAEVSIH
jgi:two-component system, OmpR family, sensor histidine kinase PrrB